MKNKKRLALSSCPERSRRASKGFTIIELIVVIAIIAILAAIVLVSVTGYIQRSRDAAVLADLRQFKTFATSYYMGSGTYSDLCNDPQAKVIGTAIHDASPSYTFHCYDIGGYFTAKANGLIPSAIAASSDSCTDNSYVAYVSKSSNDYFCASSDADNGSNDFFGSSDIEPSGCTCGE